MKSSVDNQYFMKETESKYSLKGMCQDFENVVNVLWI